MRGWAMAENTKISWAHHTFNPWLGCSKVHTGCTNCYAEAMAGRLDVVWGPNGTRRRTAESTWRQVEKWNRKAAPGICTCPGLVKNRNFHLWPCPANPDRPRVFPSLCDPFEVWTGQVADWQRGVTTLDTIREDFFALIDRTSNLDWLLLTKRPENVRRRWVCAGTGKDPGAVDYLLRDNAWLLYSASDQATLESGLPHLLACRDLVPVLGLSLEPLVGPVDLGLAHLKACPHGGAGKHVCDAVDWVIVGGESGPNARPCDVEWIRSNVRQCREAGVPCFVKLMGACCVDNDPLSRCLWPSLTQFKAFDFDVDGRLQDRVVLRDPKGGDIAEWPEDLRVQEFPR